MRPTTWLRGLSVLFALFALGHTLGTAAPRVTHGPGEAALFASMQALRFPVMGFERTHWEFYRGFAICVSVLLTAMAAVSWQVATLGRDHPRDALPFAVILQLTCFGTAIVCSRFFFAAPMGMSWVAVAISTVAVLGLVRQIKRARGVKGLEAGEPLTIGQ